MWNDTTPTSSVFSVGTYGESNGSGDAMIAYCMHSVKGFSKVGHYTGQGSANQIIYTGFRPGFLLIRKQGATANWIMIDCKRVGHNNDNEVLEAHGSGVEQTAVGDRVDILSTGFRIRNSWSDINTDGEMYIYYAIAEFPLVGTNNIPGVAR